MTTGPKSEEEIPGATPAVVQGAHSFQSGSPEKADAEQVLRCILHADADPDLLEFAGGAGGDPQLLAELAHGLVEEGLVRKSEGRVHLVAPRVPRRMVELAMSRLSDLSVHCQQFLKVAATLGGSF